MSNPNLYRTIAPSIVIVRLLWRCFFAVFAVVVGTVVLAAVPQAREALMVFAADADERRLHAAFYVCAVLYWAIAAWFTTRLLLGRRFEQDSLGTSPDDPFVDWFATVMPRGLALVATVPVCVITWMANRALGAGLGAVTFLFLVFIVLRRRFGDVDSHTHKCYAEFDGLNTVGHQACVGLLAFGFGVFGSLWSRELGMAVASAWALVAVALQMRGRPASDKRADVVLYWVVFGASFASALLMLWLGWSEVVADEVDLARRIGSPAILLCALASWTLFGGLVLTYLPLSWRWISLAPWLPPLLILAGSLFETHWVAQREPSPPAEGVTVDPDWRANRPEVDARFKQWMATHEAGEPVYMVAVMGGASRAGFWSGSVLARLEDEARAQKRRFGDNVFAISSISGGSLGAAAWVAELAQYGDLAPCEAASAGPCRRERVERFLGGDFLSPVMARLLGPDFATRFLPFPVSRSWSDQADRSLGLEKTWVQDWRALPSSSTARRVDWGRPLTELYTGAEPRRPTLLPTLLLNTVRIDDGQRFLQSNVKAELPGVMDLLADDFDTSRLTLAQAVHNSARFPYVSPAAAVRAASAPHPVVGRLGDGGYHEVSGAATLADLLELLLRQGQLREPVPGKGLWACRSGWPAAASDRPRRDPPLRDCASGASPVVALILDGAPAYYPLHHLRDLAGREHSLAVGESAPGMLLPELLAPVFGGLSTRTNLAVASQRRLSRLVGDSPDALVELRMPFWRTLDDEYLDAGDKAQGACDGHDDQPSMTWAVDRCSRARLRAATSPATTFGPHPTLGQRALLTNLGRLRKLIADGAPASGGGKGM